jgi:hypothetical protein
MAVSIRDGIPQWHEPRAGRDRRLVLGVACAALRTNHRRRATAGSLTLSAHLAYASSASRRWSRAVASSALSSVPCGSRSVPSPRARSTNAGRRSAPIRRFAAAMYTSVQAVTSLTATAARARIAAESASTWATPLACSAAAAAFRNNAQLASAATSTSRTATRAAGTAQRRGRRTVDGAATLIRFRTTAAASADRHWSMPGRWRGSAASARSATARSRAPARTSTAGSRELWSPANSRMHSSANLYESVAGVALDPSPRGACQSTVSAARSTDAPCSRIPSQSRKKHRGRRSRVNNKLFGDKSPTTTPKRCNSSMTRAVSCSSSSRNLSSIRNARAVR